MKVSMFTTAVAAAAAAVACSAAGAATGSAAARPLPAGPFPRLGSSSSAGAGATGIACNVDVDQFCHSTCNCTTFGNHQCAINATQPANLTLYRMTMAGVYGLAEKDSGDAAGDLGFVLTQRMSAYDCRVDPANAKCVSLPHFAGDDPNSTDVIIQFTVEVDGQWGPYLYCNPKNSSLPLGEWACRGIVDTLGPAGASAQCVAEYQGFPTAVWKFEFPVPKTLAVADVGECCDTAMNASSPFWSYFGNNKTCVFGSYPSPTSLSPYERYADGVMGMVDKYAPPVCDSPRTSQTVGRRPMVRENSLTLGTWYSHPAAGECAPGGYVGDGSGCTWRVVATTAAINASCMYKAIDTAVEALAPACFQACPGYPQNKTTTCYLACFSNASQHAAAVDPESLLLPWTDSFSGGCPRVPLPPPA